MIHSDETTAAFFDTARRYLAKLSEGRSALSSQDLEETFGDATTWSKFSELGWTGLLVPEHLGGGGARLDVAMMIVQEIGRYLTPVPFVASSVLAVEALRACPDRDRTDGWLNRLALGSVIGTAVLPYEAAPSPVLARRAPGGMVLDGTAPFVLDADVASLFVVVVNDSLFVVPVSEAGLAVVHTPTVDGTRRYGEVRLTAVPAEPLPVPAGTAAYLADLAALAIAADAVGGAGRALEMAVAYAASRQQFGRPIGAFQAVKHKCSDMFIALQAATVALDDAVEAMTERRDDASVVTSIAKALSTDAYAKIAGDAVQIHGGVGFTWECDLHLFLKRAKLDQALFGDPARHRDQIGRQVFRDANRVCTTVEPGGTTP